MPKTIVWLLYLLYYNYYTSPITWYCTTYTGHLCPSFAITGGTISTCPNFGKTKDCTMPKLLYFGQGSLKKIWSPCGWRFFLENHGQCTEAEALVQSAVFQNWDNTYLHSHVRMYYTKIKLLCTWFFLVRKLLLLKTQKNDTYGTRLPIIFNNHTRLIHSDARE